MFAKRHYEFIARTLRDVREINPKDKRWQACVDYTADELAGRFRSDNPRFDCDRFCRAARPS